MHMLLKRRLCEIIFLKQRHLDVILHACNALLNERKKKSIGVKSRLRGGRFMYTAFRKSIFGGQFHEHMLVHLGGIMI